MLKIQQMTPAMPGGKFMIQYVIVLLETYLMLFTWNVQGAAVVPIPVTGGRLPCNSRNSDPCAAAPGLCSVGGGFCAVKGPCEYECVCPPDGRRGRDCTSSSGSDTNGPAAVSANQGGGLELNSLLIFPPDFFWDENHVAKPGEIVNPSAALSAITTTLPTTTSETTTDQHVTTTTTTKATTTIAPTTITTAKTTASSTTTILPSTMATGTPARSENAGINLAPTDQGVVGTGDQNHGTLSTNDHVPDPYTRSNVQKLLAALLAQAESQSNQGAGTETVSTFPQMQRNGSGSGFLIPADMQGSLSFIQSALNHFPPADSSNKGPNSPSNGEAPSSSALNPNSPAENPPAGLQPLTLNTSNRMQSLATASGSSSSSANASPAGGQAPTLSDPRKDTALPPSPTGPRLSSSQTQTFAAGAAGTSPNTASNANNPPSSAGKGTSTGNSLPALGSEPPPPLFLSGSIPGSESSTNSRGNAALNKMVQFFIHPADLFNFPPRPAPVL